MQFYSLCTELVKSASVESAGSSYSWSSCDSYGAEEVPSLTVFDTPLPSLYRPPSSASVPTPSSVRPRSNSTDEQESKYRMFLKAATKEHKRRSLDIRTVLSEGGMEYELEEHDQEEQAQRPRDHEKEVEQYRATLLAHANKHNGTTQDAAGQDERAHERSHHHHHSGTRIRASSVQSDSCVDKLRKKSTV
jgi:hypothetical protein